jgi:GntR family transcriptional regulator, sialic acid-inducible nan operon repressor
MNLPVIRRRKIHEDVAERLERAIFDGVYRPGEQLPSERELMDSLQVGRTAVREALLLLDTMGLIRLTPGERARVARPTAEEVIDHVSGAARQFLAAPGGQEAFMEARRVFESAVARHAAEVATAADIDRLAAALDDNRAAHAHMATFERTDVAFHLTLTEIGGNPIFPALHRAILGWLALQRRVTLRVPGAVDLALAHHQSIFEAVARRDPEGAWTAMEAHLHDAARVYRQGEKRRLR